MDLFKKKPVPLSISDEDGIDHKMEMQPGTPEFAAAVKQMVDKALRGVAEKIGVDNWNKHCTLMFACNYDKGEGMAQSIDGNTDQLLILMGITVHTMAEAEISKKKFGKKPPNGNVVVGQIMQQLMAFVNSLDHDGNDSGIITP